MAVGDPITTITSISDGASLDIRPSGTETWLVTNIYLPDGITGVDVKITDGTNAIKIDSPSGSLLTFNFYITNAVYIQVVNNSGGSIVVGYDGVVVKA